MSDFVLSKTNYFFTRPLTSTSEDSEFPKTNMAKQARSYVWRTGSKGFYRLGSSNQELDFDEGGSALNATITTDDYDADTLAAEIKKQLDLAGAATFTVTYDTSTGKFTIVSDGATFNILWNTGTNKSISIASSIGFDDSADDTGAVTYTSDVVALHTQERIICDMGTGTPPIDTLAMFFDLNNDIQLSTAATITLKGTNSGVPWETPGVSVSITLDRNTKSAFYKFSSTESYRYWAVEIVDAANPDLYVQLDSLWLGLDLGLGQVPEIGFTDSLVDQSKKRSNKYGHEYWDEYPIRKSLQLKWNALSETDKDILRYLFGTAGKHDPVLIAIDPDESLFADMNKLLMYGRITSQYKGKHVFTTYFDYEMNILEVV